MDDCLGREIQVGDTVAYASNSDGPCLSVGTVLGPCKNGNGGIRVKVTVSGTRAGQGMAPYGQRRLREEGAPYVSSIGISERVIIVARAREDNPLVNEGTNTAGDV